MMLHGCEQHARDLAEICGVNAVAERANLLVVYPEQTIEANPCDVGIGSIQITKRARPER
jgi:poly(3-hydroxybutyrate) depolymerase